jgi:hypothetical protein
MRIKYEKPKCECGADLDSMEEHTYNKAHSINKNGTKSKKYELEHWMHNGIEYLRCQKCRNNYEFEQDEKDRIIRGRPR